MILPLSVGMGKLAGVAQVGSLDYWIKLKIPVTQSAKAHQERPEHLMTPARSIARPLNSGSSAYDNEIIITIIRCTKLPLSNQGTLLKHVLYTCMYCTCTGVHVCIL